MSEPVYMRIWRHSGIKEAAEAGFRDVPEAEGKQLIAAGVAQDAKTTSAMDLKTIVLDAPPTRAPEYSTRELKAKTRRGEPRS